MLAVSSQIFQAFGWPSTDEVTSQEYINYIDNPCEASEAFFRFNAKAPDHQFDNSPPSTTVSGDLTVVKKLNHNASERDRRKKINNTYITLRSLLPNTGNTKKLSIPQTVSRALKYIPELQNQVERLAEKKEELVSKISSRDDLYHQDKKRKRSVQSSVATVSVNRVGEQEIVVQISAHKFQKCSLSDILIVLEEEGLMLINASSSVSSGGRVFYNLQLQVERSCVFDCEALSEKILSLYEKRQELFL